MQKQSVLVVVLTVVLSVVAVSGFAAEGLFDAKAAGAHIEQGISLLGSANLDGAIAEFEKSAEIAPEAEAYYYLGYTYYLKGRESDGENREKSREYFEKAYDLDPNFSPTRFRPAEATPGEVQQKEIQVISPEPVMTTPTATPEPAPAEPGPSHPGSEREQM